MLVVAVDAVGIRGQGGAAVLCELLQWLPEAKPDWEWQVYLLPRRNREFADPVVGTNVVLSYVESASSNWGRIEWLRAGLRREALRCGADVVFSFANIAPWECHIPVVAYCHQLLAFAGGDSGNWSWKGKLRMKVLRSLILRSARNAERVIVQTHAMREAMALSEPDLAARLVVIPGGYRSCGVEGEIRSHIRRMIEGFSRPRFVYVSHPGVHKNHETLIRALPYILREEPEAHLLLTLEREQPPTRRYQNLVRPLLELAAQLGVGQRCHWLGILNPAEVQHALRHSDALVFPSMAESFGLPLAEAIAVGCPIAAADLGYAHDVAGDAATYFDPRSPGDVSRRLVELVRDRGTRERLRNAARRRVADFSYEIIAGQITSVLASATETSKRSVIL